MALCKRLSEFFFYSVGKPSRGSTLLIFLHSTRLLSLLLLLRYKVLLLDCIQGALSGLVLYELLGSPVRALLERSVAQQRILIPLHSKELSESLILGGGSVLKVLVPISSAAIL